MISQKTTLPPIISQHFNSLLLSQPMPEFRDSLKIFDEMLAKVLKKWKKLDKCPAQKQKCEQLLREIQELHERAKIKEEERKAEARHKTQSFGYSVASPKNLVRPIYERLRFGRELSRILLRGSPRKIYKVQRKMKCKAALHHD